MRGSARAGAFMFGAVCLAALLADVVAPGDPFATSAHVLQSPSWAHWCGTDDFGRDVLGSIVHGARVSLAIAVAATAAAVALGACIGGVAGYRGGLVDEALMRVTEVFQVVPRFVLVVATVALFGSGLGPLTVIIALTSWPDTARLVRAQVMSLMTFDHVTAARAVGARPIRVLLRHVLPLALPPLIAQASFQAGSAMLAEAGVSFLGLGDPSIMSWGFLLHEAHHFLRVAWWLVVFPGLALTMAVLGLQLMADARSVRA